MYLLKIYEEYQGELFEIEDYKKPDKMHILVLMPASIPKRNLVPFV